MMQTGSPEVFHQRLPSVNILLMSFVLNEPD